MSLSYRERKAKGQRKRAEYLRRLDNAEHLATMLRGVGLGSSFCVVMFAVAGIDTTLDWLIYLGVFILGGVAFVEAEHILFLAEQSRYPKSRRRTLRSEIADEFYELRMRFKKS